MRWEGREQSANVEDRRGMAMNAGGMIAGGGIGTLLLILIMTFLGANPAKLMEEVGQQQPQNKQQVLAMCTNSLFKKRRSLQQPSRRQGCGRRGAPRQDLHSEHTHTHTNTLSSIAHPPHPPPTRLTTPPHLTPPSPRDLLCTHLHSYYNLSLMSCYAPDPPFNSFQPTVYM